MLEIEPCDFLNIFVRFWPFEPHFLINVFHIKKTCNTTDCDDDNERKPKTKTEEGCLVVLAQYICGACVETKRRQF